MDEHRTLRNFEKVGQWVKVRKLNSRKMDNEWGFMNYLTF